MERYELLLEAAHRKYGDELVLAGASAVAAYGCHWWGRFCAGWRSWTDTPAGCGPPC